MELLLWLIVVLSGFGILHNYLIYPMWVLRKSRRVSNDNAYFSSLTNEVAISSNQHDACYFDSNDNNTVWPAVSVLMAVHNEEKVLEEKLRCLLNQDYPGQYNIYIGSDNSSDRTNDILQEFAAKDDRLNIKIFTSRQGKPGIINQLTALAPPPGNDHFYLLTDASVMLADDVVTQLIKPSLKLNDLTVIDARMIHTGIQQHGISKTEDQYISGEVKLKQAEGRLWGYMMGPFGGCYALRSDVYERGPDNFLVDDFFLCMAAYEQGGKGISVAEAHCYEGVGQHLKDEFRRKVRISSGNWQNTVRFRQQWWPPVSELSFAFFSHKILRWLTPFLIIVIMLGLLLLSLVFGNYWATLAFSCLASLLLLPPMLDILLSQLFGIHWQPLRAIRYFLAMNLALLVGFFRFLKGIQSNVWQPSQRH